MMTSGLVVLLESDSTDGNRALAAIRSEPRLTIGQQADRLVPVAVETEDPAECEHWHEWLRTLPGVTDVEVVFVHWDEPEETHAGR
jgi:hypothetical protein